MKHSEVLSLRAKLQKVKGLKGRELNFEIKTNIIEINRIVEPLAAMEKEIDDILNQYNEERIALFIKNSTEGGEVKKKIVNNIEVYVVSPEKVEAHEKEFKKLQAKFKKDLDKHKKEYSAFLKFLSETESKFKISKVKRHHVPEDISTEDLDLIYDIIEEKNR